MSGQRLAHTFVESIPSELDDDTVYVSIDFRTTIHLCACGCRNQVVLPLRPSAWSLTYDGQEISMSPSVGNWSFDCRSHYWIRHGIVVWASEWSEREVEAGRARTLVERAAIPPDRPDTWEDRSWWRRLLRGLATKIGNSSRSG